MEMLMYVVIGCILLLLLLLSLLKKKQSTKQDAILLLGPSGSGKTAFFHLLRDHAFIDTITSMKENMQTFMVDDKSVTVVDYPGHSRLRAHASDFYPLSKSLCFFLDGSNFSKAYLRSSAEYLYDILSHPAINMADSSRTLTIVCNKADQPSSSSCDKFRTALAKELTQLAKTAASSTMQMEEEEEDRQVLGRKNQAFEFEIDSPVPVEFVQVSVKTGQEIPDLINKLT